METKKRNEILKMRLTSAEMQQVKMGADSIGINVSEYVRRKIFDANSINPLYSQNVKAFLDITTKMYKITRAYSDVSEMDHLAWKSFCKEYEMEVERLWLCLK